MIPKYPYLVRVRRKTGSSRIQEDKWFEGFGAANAYYTGSLGSPLVTGATIMMVLDDTSKGGQNGDKEG